jgi:hypothetical protein
MSASDNLSTKCSGFLLRSSFAILAARTRHLISVARMAAFSVASRLSNASDILLRDMAEKAPAVDGPGQVGRAERNVEFSPSRSATSVGRLRAEHPLVALPTFWVLFIQKFACRSQGTKTFDLNQNFEPRARNRRPTIDVGGCEDAHKGAAAALATLCC